MGRWCRSVALGKLLLCDSLVMALVMGIVC
jgi:hypothetical protein